METKAAESAGELAALEGLVADLGPLAGLLPERAAPEQDFNMFELLNQWWQEDVHSRCLTWLLDPQGSHDTGVYFLENFLLHTAERSASLGTPTIEKDCIRGGAWSEATSQREWYTVLDGGSGWLDILLVNEGRKIICAIENKIFSPESGRQLTFYQKALERDYCGFTRHYVFLSPTGMAPVHSEDRAFWTPVSYSGVLELVERMVAGHAGTIGEDIRWFLRQYAGTLRRNIMPVPNAVQKRAREIYIAHREVIEMVCQHKPAYPEKRQTGSGKRLRNRKTGNSVVVWPLRVTCGSDQLVGKNLPHCRREPSFRTSKTCCSLSSELPTVRRSCGSLFFEEKTKPSGSIFSTLPKNTRTFSSAGDRHYPLPGCSCMKGKTS